MRFWRTDLSDAAFGKITAVYGHIDENAEATGSNRATLKILRTFSSPDSLPQYLAKEITIWV